MRQQAAPIRTARRPAGSHRGRATPARYRTSLPFAYLRAERRSAASTSHCRTEPATLDPILLGACTWLACGTVLLGLTPLPLHDAHLGWSFTFWALAAPLMVLLVRRLRTRLSAVAQRRPKRLL